MNAYDILQLAVYEDGVQINDTSDLENLHHKLEENSKRCKETIPSDGLGSHILSIIKEDAVSPDFNEEIVRKALSLGYYPMSMEKLVLSQEEFDTYNELISNMIPKRENEVYAWRYFMTIRHHQRKMIINFNDFTFPKKTRRYVRQKFGDYTLTFNRNFELCAERLIAQYEAKEGTWVVPPLLDTFRKIHQNPDNQVSVDSVELWRGEELVAGELGFITHNAYASLCGFHTESNSGTIQMAALGTILKEKGFAYWDLGMEMEYKYVYGAICMGRSAQKTYYERLAPTRLALPKEEFKIKDLIKT